MRRKDSESSKGKVEGKEKLNEKEKGKGNGKVKWKGKEKGNEKEIFIRALDLRAEILKHKPLDHLFFSFIT